MDLLIMIAVIFSLIIVFVILQLIGILFLLQENKRIGEELEKNSPPFWFDKTAEMRHANFDLNVKYLITWFIKKVTENSWHKCRRVMIK